MLFLELLLVVLLVAVILAPLRLLWKLYVWIGTKILRKLGWIQ